MAYDGDADLGVLYRIGLAVERVVREAHGSPHRADTVAMGADGTPTEELDRVAEAEVLRMLDAERVDWNVVSEEIGRVDRGGTRTLVVDPIDGSSNALRNLPFSTVSLAVGRDDLASVDVGLVRDLERGSTFWASRGGGAYLNGRRLRTRPWSPSSEIVFLNLGDRASPRAVALAGAHRKIRSLGCASLEIAYVAAGAADGYVFEGANERHNLRATDIAAAFRILAEAGGGAAGARGDPLDRFPFDVTRRTPVVAWGDPKFGKALVAGGHGG